jgi:A/G-specific adenine glycosylase
MSAKEDVNKFVAPLLHWSKGVDRRLAWKGGTAYEVWLSEILLQQTRLEQGRPYYDRFLAAFPNIQALAAADISEILLQWQGLGYYARARNLHKAAGQVMARHGGEFPSNYADILALSGVGAYTAAAISSFVFGLPYAVVDGNVYRVLSRFFGVDLPIDTGKGQLYFAELAQRLLDKSAPADYNQAIMDFGALVCTPKAARCVVCPLQADCVAYKEQKIQFLPFKAKKIRRRSRYFFYFVYLFEEKVYLHRRAAGDIWEGLHDFPVFEADALLAVDEAMAFAPFKPEDAVLLGFSNAFKQVLTHQDIHAIFINIVLASPLKLVSSNGEAVRSDIFAVDCAALGDYAQPKLILDYWQQRAQFMLPYN